MLLIKFPVPITTYRLKNPTVEFYYPGVYELQDYRVQSKMNYDIYNQMLDLIEGLKQPDLVTYIDGSYEIKTNERDILSINLIGLGDFHGAHPVTIVRSLNFDVKTGKKYMLKDLFKEDSDYQKVLSELVCKELEAQKLNLFEECRGIRPDQDYYIADKNLIIYFQQYEIAPYYVGFPYASIPLYEMQELIPEGGLLNRLISLE